MMFFCWFWSSPSDQESIECHFGTSGGDFSGVKIKMAAKRQGKKPSMYNHFGNEQAKRMILGVQNQVLGVN